jgi:hypothetical protein
MTDRIRVWAITAMCLLALVPVATMARRDNMDGKDAVARGTDTYCMGFISDVRPSLDIQVVGAIRENQKFIFVEGDKIFINKGFDARVQKGSVYQIIRPLGEFRHPFTGKSLGYFVREAGLLRVIDVDRKVSTAEIIVSCEPVALGDVVRPYQPIAVPVESAGPAGRPGPGGKARGQIVMSSRYQEYLSANQIVYIDMGAKDGLQPGDRLTISRKIGKSEGFVRFRDDEVVPRRERDLGSNRYRGGNYPISTTVTPYEEVLHKRPELPLKVVGQLVLLKVQGSTSVALITKTSEWVNIGDWVERSN